MTNETFCKLDDNAKQYWLDGARNAVLVALQKSVVPREQWTVVLGMTVESIAEFMDRNRVDQWQNQQ